MSSLAARAYMKGEKAKHELRRKMEGVCFQNKTLSSAEGHERREREGEEVSLHGIEKGGLVVEQAIKFENRKSLTNPHACHNDMSL